MERTRDAVHFDIHITQCVLERLIRQREYPLRTDMGSDWYQEMTKLIGYNQRRLTWLLNELNSTPPTQAFHRDGRP